MHSLSESKKKRIIRDIIIGARLYGKFLVPHDFLIVTSDGKYNEVRFHKEDFAHLVGVRSYLNDLDFYKNCIKGTIAENNIKDQQHYDFGTIRKKIMRITKIHKIIYADAQTNLVLVNLHTKTHDFPLAIENTHDKMVVAFLGKDLHARSLRNNNQTNADEKKSILAIFSKEKNSKSNYSNCVYLKNYGILKGVCCDLNSKVSVKILNNLQNNNIMNHLS